MCGQIDPIEAYVQSHLSVHNLRSVSVISGAMHATYAYIDISIVKGISQNITLTMPSRVLGAHVHSYTYA